MLDDFAQWLKDTLLWMAKKLWADMLEAGKDLINAIPVPDFVNTASGYMNGIPSSILWTLNMFAVSEGIVMIGGALILRFLVRRIPLFG